MELQFQKEVLSCLKPVVCEVQELEQTQELRLPQDMPEVGRILGAWAQPVMRGKQWQGSTAELTAGMLVWVLYIPESGGGVQRLESWIPFRMRWDLPENCPEGKLRILLLPRFVDARSVSAGKILIRAGAAALGEAWCPWEQRYYRAERVPDQVELLRRTYPLRLIQEAGEKQISLEEALTLPASAPRPGRVLYFSLNPEITDRKVMADKVVFRGNGNLHLCYESEEGQVHCWDYELPFSQFAQLEESRSADARADVLLMVTGLELTLGEDGGLQLQAGLAAQYLVDDRRLLELTEDAYSPERELIQKREELELPALLDSRQETFGLEQKLPGCADLVVDTQILPDFPRLQAVSGVQRMEMSAQVQALYYDDRGELQSSTRRWNGSRDLQAEESSVVVTAPQRPMEAKVLAGSTELSVQTELPVQIAAVSGQGLPMVTELQLGALREKDPDRPSLILRRTAQEGLWEIARSSGSTVEAIRSANGLEGEPEPGRMLLIPVL